MEGIRSASTRDLPRILELYEDLRLEFSEYRGRWYELDAWPEPAQEALAAALDDPDTNVIVGTIDDYIVGYLVVCLRPTLPQAATRHVGLIHDVYVEIDARAVGVGEALLSAAIDWLTSRGVNAVDVTVLPGHRAAKNFLEQNGFAARSITMHAHWTP